MRNSWFIPRLVLIFAVLAFSAYQGLKFSKENKSDGYRGTLVDFGFTTSYDRRGREIQVKEILTLRQDNGQIIERRFPSVDSEWYKLGDYIVKIAGKDKPAVFRNGSQVKIAPCFLREDVDLKKLTAPTPAPTPAVTIPPAFSKTEEEAVRLLNEASRLWNEGDHPGAARLSEQALEIRVALYGQNDPRVKQTRDQVEAARAAAVNP